LYVDVTGRFTLVVGITLVFIIGIGWVLLRNIQTTTILKNRRGTTSLAWPRCRIPQYIKDHLTHATITIAMITSICKSKPKCEDDDDDDDDDTCDCWCVGYQDGVHGTPTNPGPMTKEACLNSSNIFEVPGQPVYEEHCACGKGWWELDE
jgi:hypothetical protein